MRITALAFTMLAIKAYGQTPAAPTPGTAPQTVPVVTPIMQKSDAFCKYIETCIKSRPGKSAYCVKTGLKESGMLDHVLEGDQAKELSRFLRKDGFIDKEANLSDFAQLPDGAILVLDAHDPVKDKRPACPKVYGNVLVKCGEKWIDDSKNDLDFHMKRGCRSKGIWLHADAKLKEDPKQKRQKRLITDPHPAAPKKSDD